MDTNPMIWDDKRRTAPALRHMTSNTTGCAVHRTDRRVTTHRLAVALQTGLFRPGDQHCPRRILVRIVTIHARDLSGSLPPTLAVAQSRDLVRDQQIIRKRVLYLA